MKILVTGASGFIGNHLMNMLKKNHTVHGISHSQKNKNIPLISLHNQKKLTDHLQKNNYDVVIHLAAILKDDYPLRIIKNNCETTINLLESCVKSNVSNFIFTSSQLVYGTSQYLPIDENHPKNPSTNYAISKLLSEEICKMYNNTYHLPVKILRLSSVYGKEQPSNYLIPRLMKNCLNNKELVIHKYENDFQLMDFIHVKDVCNAILLACKSKINFGIFNISSGKPITVNDIAKKISKISKVQPSILTINKETNHMFFDISNAKNTLNFKPNVLMSQKILQDIYESLKN